MNNDVAPIGFKTGLVILAAGASATVAFLIFDARILAWLSLASLIVGTALVYRDLPEE